MKLKVGFFLAVMTLPFIPLKAQYIQAQDPGLKYSEKTFGNKMLRGSGYALGYNTVIMTALVLSPEYISQWDRKEAFLAASMKAQYKKTFTTPPVKDKDLAVINYIGHPYQGSFYFNATRSQGYTGHAKKRASMVRDHRDLYHQPGLCHKQQVQTSSLLR